MTTRNIFSSFRTQVTLAFVFSLLFVMSLSSLFIYRFSLDEQFQQLRKRLTAIATTAALMVDADELNQIPLNRTGVGAPAFQSINNRLNKIKSSNADITYAYIMKQTGQPGILQFVVDPNPVAGSVSKKKLSAFPGDQYDARPYPALLAGFRAPSADDRITSDEWGVVLSGYAPVKAKDGSTVAVLGVDMSADDVHKAQRQLFLRALVVLLAGVILSVFLGMFISGKITSRIHAIVDGTRRIARDDLGFRVDVQGDDEIGELAYSFNQMARSLLDSRNKLKDYFHRAVQSLVRLLEAKDPYTKGHSERVAEYAGKIGIEMGLDKEKVELLRKAAQLHDIGKLVVQETILNKPGKLTDEEWHVIKEHPVTGEEVLKPTFIGEEVLATVREHHERFDGSGYPDGAKGDTIKLFAQIISVADSYDAMTSPRAYRPATTKEKAIEELKAGSGSQFNPAAVKAFLRVIENEK